MVVISAHFEPFLSKRAFVATVVPNLNDSILDVSNGSPRGILVFVKCSRILLIPSKFESE